MNTQFKRLRDQVALEAYAVSDLSGLVSRIIPSVADNLASFKGMFVQAPMVSLSGEKDFLKSLDKRTYPSLMPLTAYVPEGMKKTYVEYAEKLFAAVNHVAVAPSIIDEYATFLSMLVSNKDAILETATRKRAWEALYKKREEANHALQSCFDSSTTTTRKIEDVIKRNADWKPLTDLINEMNVGIARIERSHLNKQVENCSDLIERIRKLIDQGHFEKSSPETIMDLADGAYQVASELEFYAVVFYRVQGLTQAVERTFEHVKKATAM